MRQPNAKEKAMARSCFGQTLTRSKARRTILRFREIRTSLLLHSLFKLRSSRIYGSAELNERTHVEFSLYCRAFIPRRWPADGPHLRDSEGIAKGGALRIHCRMNILLLRRSAALLARHTWVEATWLTHQFGQNSDPRTTVGAGKPRASR
jgi:hypothetical protein